MLAGTQLAVNMDNEPNPGAQNPYLPLTEQNAARFLRDFEGFVLSCIRRMRIRDEEDVLYRIFRTRVGWASRF